MKKTLLALGCCSLMAACTTQPMKPSDGHLRAEPPVKSTIPAPVTQVPPLPVPRPTPKLEFYSVSVVNVPVQDVLFALARDARLNLDIHPGIAGNVTLNAIDQTLPQILTRLTKQADMRYEVEGQNLIVMPDTPYLRHYKIDYINMARDTTGEVSISASISGTSSSSSTTGGTVVNAFGSSNISNTKVLNTAKNRFWETLVQNVKDLLRETDKIIVESATEVTGARTGAPPTGATPSAAAPGQAGQQGAPGQAPAVAESMAGATARRVSYREAASVIANAETGVITVRATARQHEKVLEFLDAVGASARRQVLIEATIVEVQLSDNYQQGIDWDVVWKGAGLTFQLPQINPTTGQPVTPPSGANPNFGILAHTGGSINVAVRLLESFGTARVLSSPKLSVLNNQTAVLKVVRNDVYFTINATDTTVSNGVVVPGTITATPNTVPIGLVMSVTPQISESDSVQLNLRPTISRRVGNATDPTPGLAVPNLIPIIQTNEMESLIKVNSGQIAVMGGLMQDEINHADDTLPGIGRVPLLGEAFTFRNDTKRKVELVIFLRPVVVKNASLDGDYASFRHQLPDGSFMTPPYLGPNFFQSPEEATRPGPPFEGN